MPLFEYKCERCGDVDTRIFSTYERMIQSPAIRCEKDGSRMERIVSAPAFTVNGFNAKNNYGVKS